MTERIRELADRLWRVHPSEIDAMGLKTRTEFYEQELTKFAELIVWECTKIIADAVDHREPASTYVGKIKQHFGMDE